MRDRSTTRGSTAWAFIIRQRAWLADRPLRFHAARQIPLHFYARDTFGFHRFVPGELKEAKRKVETKLSVPRSQRGAGLIAGVNREAHLRMRQLFLTVAAAQDEWRRRDRLKRNVAINRRNDER